jgi:NAD(P)-dependent dehydrogenase (short-subunit alcohol dehydrogenase family)
MGETRLEGKVAVVTGAGEGIGRGIATLLGRHGAAVAMGGRTVSKIEAVRDDISASGGQALAVRCDVSVRHEVDGLVEAAASQFGPPDILVNNAQGRGSTPLVDGSPLEEITDQEMLDLFRGSVLATLYGMQACFPHMKNRGGTIVNLGSRRGVEGTPGATPYGTAKEGIRGLTKHAAREWGRYGITVNVVCPAALSTGSARYRDADPDRWERTIQSIPLRYMGDPLDDIAPVVVALATDLHYLTGATLMLDGGMCILR